MVKEINYKNTQVIKDLWHFIRGKKVEFLILSFFLVITAILALVPPIILAKIIDYFIEGGTLASTFYWFLTALLAVMIAENFIGIGTKHLFNLLVIKIQKQAKVESMQKVLQGDLIWHDKENTGNKMQRVQEGERAVESFLRFYANQFIGMIVTVVGIIGVFAFFNIKYAIIGILYISIYIYAEIRLNKKLARKIQKLKIAQEYASGKAYEFSSNIATIKSLGIEKSSQSQILGQEEAVLQARKERRTASTRKWMIVEVISTIFFLIFILFVGKDVLAGILTIGSIVIYIEYTRRLGGTLNLLSNITVFLIDSKFGLYRMMEIHRSIQSHDERGAKNITTWKKIRLKDVSFNYGKEQVLDKLNLTINRGQKVGIVGTSGSGKSTLFKLLLKLYIPKEGKILFDDTDLKDIKSDSILQKISIVPQETELFNLSLRDNITISETNSVKQSKYNKSILISQVDKIIKKLRAGDSSIIGEKGVRLSGGERQRIGIARAIYKNSEIIIFDEATSNLDYITEKRIFEAMDSKLKGKTIIIAAHRLETLKGMDNILYMENGKIVEQGTYSQLIKQKGRFARLLQEQKSRKTK
ncbi:MAG: ABC transporter ATP-binding protein [Nanoarchaeota archaeon]|nr:ABC transporter ATP-binding protein [Nanoarchaeota archaeon]